MGFSQVIVFTSEGDFKEIIAANQHMTAIMGADDYTKRNFPGVFIAGIKANSQGDKEPGCPSSTQK